MHRVAVLLGAVSVVWLALASLPVHADTKCPENSTPQPEEKRQVGDKVIIPCRCNSGFVPDGNWCHPKTEIDRLMVRAEAALAGAKHSAEALEVEANFARLDYLRSRAGALAMVIGAAMQKRPDAVWRAVLGLSVDVSMFLDDERNCRGSEAIRTNCENLRNFNRILEETRAAIDKLKGS